MIPLSRNEASSRHWLCSPFLCGPAREINVESASFRSRQLLTLFTTFRQFSRLDAHHDPGGFRHATQPQPREVGEGGGMSLTLHYNPSPDTRVGNGNLFLPSNPTL